MTKRTPLRILMNAPMHERALRAEAVAAAGRRIARFVQQLAKAFRQRRRFAALATLDDRALKDIGISPDEVQNAMSQPLWAFKPIELKRWRGPGDRSLDALARLHDSELYCLSETGQRLRREARRPR